VKDFFESNKGLADDNVDAILQAQQQGWQHGVKQHVTRYVTTARAWCEQPWADQADLPKRVIIAIIFIKIAFAVVVVTQIVGVEAQALQSGSDNLLIVRRDLGFAKRRCGNLLHEGCASSGAVEEQLVQDKNDIFGEWDIGVIAVARR
jgi:hypothetical protein